MDIEYWNVESLRRGEVIINEAVNRKFIVNMI